MERTRLSYEDLVQENEILRNQVSQFETQNTNIASQLLESQQKYKCIITASSDGVSYTYNGKIIEINQQLAEMFGYTREEFLQLTLNDLIYKDDLPLVISKIQNNNKERYEHRGVGKDGQIIFVEARAQDVFIDGKNMRLTILRDITEQKRKERITKARLHLLEFSYNCTSTDLLQKTIDLAEKITNSTIGFYHFLKTDQNTLSLQSWSSNTLKNMCTAEGQGQHYDVNLAGVWVECVHLRKPVIHNDYPNLSYRKGLPAGHAPMLRELVIPVIRNDKIVSIIGVGNKPTDYNENDITALMQLADLSWDIVERIQAQELLKDHEQKLKQQNEEFLQLNEALTISNERIRRFNEELLVAKTKADESNRLKSAFLQNMSHEIRTPLNAIIGFSEMLNRPNVDGERKRKYTGIIIESSSQLLKIMSDIIDISKIETGQVDVFEKSVNLNELLDEIEYEYEDKITEKELGFNLYKALDNKQCSVFVDEVKLQQVLINLLLNAIKFTPEGNIVMGYRIDNNFIEFYIEDSGIGIETNMQDVIFERFRQAELTLSRKFGGTGLGLAIAKSFVEIMGGKIWVKSELMKGSTFYFTIPYKPANTTNKPNETNVVSYSDWSNFAILVVENEELNFLYLQETLQPTGIQLLHAKNGADAVQLCETHDEINLVLMDIKLPVMNGIEATMQIKKNHPKLPVIAMTALLMTTDSVDAHNAGCDDFITKPINSEKLFDIIGKFMSII